MINVPIDSKYLIQWNRIWCWADTKDLLDQKHQMMRILTDGNVVERLPAGLIHKAEVIYNWTLRAPVTGEVSDSELAMIMFSSENGHWLPTLRIRHREPGICELAIDI